jgi:uncharacterized protein (DUF433 family)
MPSSSRFALPLDEEPSWTDYIESLVMPPHLKGVDWPTLSKRWAVFQSSFNEMLARSARRPWGLEESNSDLRYYAIPVFKAFDSAVSEYPEISVDAEVMGGAPCIAGTRIPVYMVLDAIEHYGEVSAALRSYPSLNLEQIKAAVGFAKLVIECPIDERSAPAA